jgi:hypothetical protein
MSEIEWNTLLDNKNVDQMWEIISGKVGNLLSEFIPYKQMASGLARSRKPVWMDDRLLGKIRRKKEAFSHYLDIKEGKDYVEYKRAHNATRNDVRRAVRDYEKEIAKQAKNHPKVFYKFVNGKLKTRAGVAEVKTEDGKVIETDKGKAEEFNKFFSSVFTREDHNNIPEKKVNVTKSLNNIEFSEEDVKRLLHGIDSSKSTGPDQIHPWILKECAEELAHPIYSLFRASLSAGKLPQAWKDGNITPFFKKGSRATVSNYRPVSLTSVCCKTFEKSSEMNYYDI